MKRFAIIALSVIAFAVGAISLLFWLHHQSCIQNTTYAERYSTDSFARVTVGMPRAKVIELLGTPLSTATNPSYPVWALRNAEARNRYGKDNKIPIEFVMFSASKDYRRDFNWVQVAFGPDGTVWDTWNYITD